MSGFEFYVDLFDQTIPSKLGSGPLPSVTRWTYTARLDRAGSVALEMSATDPQASHIRNRTQARGYALLNGVWTNVGYGLLDKVETIPGQDGRATVRISGLDIIGRLNYRNMRNMEFGAGSGTTLAAALSDIIDEFVPGFTFLVDGTVPNDYFYAKFDGESILSALVYLAEKTETHFYLSGVTDNAIVTFTADFTDSGIRAVRAGGDLATNACAITSLTKTVDTSEFLNRMYVRGAGEDWDSALTLAATDRVAPAGYTLNASESYIQNDVAIAEEDEIVDHPEVHFPEISPIANTDADYVAAANMLFDVALRELTRRSTKLHQETYTLAVANCNALLRPMQTIRLVYKDAEQGIDIDDDLYILEATLEMDANGARTTGLVVSTEDHWPRGANDNGARRAVQSKVFQTHPQSSLNEWESYKTMLVGNDGSTDFVGEFPFLIGPGTILLKQVLFRFKVEQVLAALYTYALAAGDTDQNAAANTGSTSVTIDNETVNVQTTSLTVSASGSTDIGTTILPEEPASPDAFTDTNFNDLGEATQGMIDDGGGDHHHDVTQHVHDFTHTHEIGGHDHAVITEHGHSVDPNPHDHVVDAHSHTNTGHVHSSPQHIHGLPDLNGTFGLVQAPALSTYAMSDLEYAINGGSWVSLDTATDVSGGYFQVDITTECTHPTIPQRPAQSSGNNLVEIRRKSAAATGKSAQIQGIVYVRSVIQAVTVS